MMPFLEVRSDSIFISGFVNITEKESHFLNEQGKKFKEVILPKAFERSLSRSKNVDFLLNHDENKVLGNLMESENFKLYENEVGLKLEAEIRESEIVQKVKENRSFLNGFSFGFIEKASQWEKKDGYNRRLLSDLELLEVSLLTGNSKPAYPSATVMEVRSQGILERRYSDFEWQESNVDSSMIYERTLRYLNLKGMYIK